MKERSMRGGAVWLAMPVLFFLAASAQGWDTPGFWPGWRGPDRTGVSQETGYLEQWPNAGPKRLWTARGLGEGYSTPSVAQGRVFVLGTQGEDEFLFVLKEEDGTVVRQVRIGPMAEVGYAGPRSTPTVDGDMVYALGSQGDLIGASVDNLKIRWRTQFTKDFGGRYGSWGYAESPLIDGNTLVCTPGGPNGTIVALNKNTGRPLWKATVPRAIAAYASPIVADFGRNKHYVQFVSIGVVGVDAKTGRLLWTYKNSSNGTANIPTPIYHDGKVFSASGYGTGGGLVRLAAHRGGVNATEVYFTRDMVNHHGGIVLVDGHLYGTNEQTLLCLDFATGKLRWRDRSVGKGSITCVDGHLYVRGENGRVALVEATPDEYRERGRFTPPDRSGKPAWPHPVVTGGRLYLRDQDVLHCYDVSASGADQ